MCSPAILNDTVSLGDTIIDQCRNRKWGEMEMSGFSGVPGQKLLMVACRQIYEENSNYKLETYDNYLMETVGSFYSLMLGCVNLADFTTAHVLAVKKLEDDAVASKISDYVKKHASVLGCMLKDESVPEFVKESTLKSFPFIENIEQTSGNETQDLDDLQYPLVQE